MTNGRNPVIQFTDMSFQYKSQQKPTLYDINLTIYEGEKVLILGASGSGKSTLMNCINGIVPFSYEGRITGSVKVNGKETRELSIFKLSNEVGTVLQDSDAQFVGLSVGEDIAFSMENNNIPREEMLPNVLARSQKVGMEDFLAALPFYLSGGQKQKVALAGVLGEYMNILLFDEPLASLDPKTGAITIDMIDQIARDGNSTVLIVEHRLEDVLYRPVDRVVVMDAGRIVSDSTAFKLLCSDTLRSYGIREPLYIAALKYAGCDINKINNLEYLEKIDFSDIDKEKLLTFFQAETGSNELNLGDETLRLENVTYSYDKKRDAVKNISFSIRKGERVALIGKNGAGKSTIARLLCGISRTDSGDIFINGNNTKPMSIKEIGEEVGFVMQNPNQMIVKDIIIDEVELALKVREYSPDVIKEKSAETLRICELYRMRNWPVDAVSYGQKKRITVASILALEPDIILLDEPTAGQDYRHYMEIINFINKLSEQYHKTIVFITHDMHLAIENTDRAIVISEGELIMDDSVFMVLSDDETIDKANLKQTSLYTLARMLNISPEKTIEHYINYERMYRANEQ